MGRVGARVRVGFGGRLRVAVLDCTDFSNSIVLVVHCAGCGAACADAIWASFLIESAPSSSPTTICWAGNGAG